MNSTVASNDWLYEPPRGKTNNVAQSDQCLLCADPSFLHTDSEDWSDWVDAQADPSLRWAHNYTIGFVVMRLIL